MHYCQLLQCLMKASLMHLLVISQSWILFSYGFDGTVQWKHCHCLLTAMSLKPVWLFSSVEHKIWYFKCLSVSHLQWKSMVTKTIFGYQYFLRRNSYKFGMTWGWVNDDRTVIFGWTITWFILVCHKALLWPHLFKGSGISMLFYTIKHLMTSW